MNENTSVLLINQSIDAAGIIANAAFVIGLTAGRVLPDESFGSAVTDGEGSMHRPLTNIGHMVRKASAGKLKTLRNQFAANPAVQVTDYTEDAAPADYQAYTDALASHKGDEIIYRAVHVYGPSDFIIPLTKNLSRL